MRYEFKMLPDAELRDDSISVTISFSLSDLIKMMKDGIADSIRSDFAYYWYDMYETLENKETDADPELVKEAQSALEKLYDEEIQKVIHQLINAKQEVVQKVLDDIIFPSIFLF